ncbi:hypothetical protein JFV29_03480 [Peribacillus sp. TH16]|uniref:hypothetical protein n=1 Tax=Peribacillus sp. TH16 TaxID=2798482 RepID=UPI001911A5A0|nr:hypothetical protein [Peribacillus sp. TH16]MBK5480998.1 hypothetical protein [Peribacillus sp. TH16]
MNQWKPEEDHILNSLPTNIGDKIDLFGSLIVNIGNILTVLGIAVEAQEVEEIEEVEGLENPDSSRAGTGSGTSSRKGKGKGKGKGSDSDSDSGSGSESNVGFALALIGAIIITIGDLVSSSGVAIEIEQSAILEKKEEQEAKEQSRKMRKMENQITSLQKDVNSLLQVSESLKREVIFLQNVIYPNYHQ